MKVEAGESLMFSWLRHVKGCQIVQLNWKPSPVGWTLHDVPAVEALVTELGQHFLDAHGRKIFNKGTASQLLKQGEIDVLGLRMTEGTVDRLFAVDIANHHGGLLLGSLDDTIARVLKKLVRSAATVHGTFPGHRAEVVFATPRVGEGLRAQIVGGVQALNQQLAARNLAIETRLLCNEEFASEVLGALVQRADRVADTSELFLRSLQLWRLLDQGPRLSQPLNQPQDALGGEASPVVTKIGGLVRMEMDRLIAESLLGPTAVADLESLAFSRDTFRQSYPVLKKVDLNRSQEAQHKVGKYGRFYSVPLQIGEGSYLLCSQWEERHRAPFMAWLEAMRSPQPT